MGSEEDEEEVEEGLGEICCRQIHRHLSHRRTRQQSIGVSVSQPKILLYMKI